MSYGQNWLYKILFSIDIQALTRYFLSETQVCMFFVIFRVGSTDLSRTNALKILFSLTHPKEWNNKAPLVAMIATPTAPLFLYFHQMRTLIRE